MMEYFITNISVMSLVTKIKINFMLAETFQYFLDSVEEECFNVLKVCFKVEALKEK